MPINSNIPLAGRPIDTASGVYKAQDQQNQNSESAQRVLGQHYQNLNDREKSRLTSTIAGAAQLKTFLDADDLQGAENYLMTRRQNLTGRMGTGEAIDTQDTDAALEMLRGGNLDELKNSINGLHAAGQVYGIIDPVNEAGGSTGVLVDRLIKEGSAKDVNEALQLIKGGAGQAGRNQADIQTGGDANFATQSGQNQSDLQYKPQIAGAQSNAVFEAEKMQKHPKVIATLESALASKQMVFDKVQQAIPKVNAFTAGFFGSTTNFVPGSPSADLKADLLTIQANAGFDKLQEMRDNSPTGGALGQVSERELALLQATWSNLEQSQSPEQLRQRLQEFSQQIEDSWARVNRAYELDYGNTNQGQQGSIQPNVAPGPQNNQAPQQGQRVSVFNAQTGEAFEIDAADLAEAQQDGFQQR